MKLQWQVRHDGETQPVPIVSDGAIATRGYGDGRLLPVLILDTSSRPDIDALILAHRDLGPGDATSVWGRPSRFNSDTLRLMLRFTNPSECIILLDFDPVRHGGIVDQIVQTEGMYLLAGRPGDRLRSMIDHPKVSIEIPTKEFRPVWEQMFRNAMFKDFRKAGMRRAEARRATDSVIRGWREVGSKRMRRDPV